MIEHSTDNAARGIARPTWAGFALWLLFGAFSAMTVIAILSIGIFVLPFTIAAGWLAHRGAPDARPALGFISGIGAISVLVAWLNRNDDPRTFDVAPWLAAGVGLLLLGIIGFAVAMRPPGRCLR